MKKKKLQKQLRNTYDTCISCAWMIPNDKTKIEILMEQGFTYEEVEEYIFQNVQSTDSEEQINQKVKVELNSFLAKSMFVMKCDTEGLLGESKKIDDLIWEECYYWDSL
jgi:hypothetical protein